jgi:hypothetical protein
VLVVFVLALAGLGLAFNAGLTPAAAAPDRPATGLAMAPATHTSTGSCGFAWRTPPNPVLTTSNNVLRGVAARAANDVWAVGYGEAGHRSLILHWDGSAWSQVPSPNPSTGDNRLMAVAAISPDDAWAVGYGTVDALILHWDGSTWSRVNGPGVPGTGVFLRGITAVAANDIWAVGYYGTDTGNSRTLTLHWNGTAWSIVPSPNAAVGANELYAVTALGTHDVWAAGAVTSVGALALHWDGFGWAVVTDPLSANPTFPAFYGVVAHAANDIWAVGDQAVTAHWDGSAWTEIPNPESGSSANILYGVAMTSADNVWAVGLQNNGQALIEHWNGSVWSVDPGAGGGPLPGVAMVNAGDIWAVHDNLYDPPTEPLTEHYSDPCVTPTPTVTGTPATATPSPTPLPPCVGQWATVAVPGAAPGSRINGLASIAQNDVWAAGYATTAQGVEQTLMLHWDGSGWNAVPSPNHGSGNNRLNAVTARAANDVWAVGQAAGGGGTTTLILHWDGSAWTEVASPSPGVTDNQLNGVVSLAADNAWAVGGADMDTLVLHWNGTNWSRVASPSPGGVYGASFLNSVSALAANDIWAAGAYQVVGYGETLVLHWDGSSWTQVPSPSPGVQYDDVLKSVAMVSAGDGWAVGSYTFNNSRRTLTLHWDGASWTQVGSPAGGSGDNVLSGSTAGGPTDVWAVGNYTSGAAQQTMILHWNGSVWTLVPSGNAGTGDNRLYAVAAGPAGEVWAAGSYGAGTTARPLIEHYPADCMSSTPTATPPAPTATATRTPVPPATPTATPAATACPVQFADVPNTNPFYSFIRCLVCRGIVGGYADNTFRPYNGVTRGQTAKFVANAAGYSDAIPVTRQTFTDVPNSDPFWLYIERVYSHGVISGYSNGDGSLSFRPSNPVTRGQMAKFVANAANLIDDVTGRQTFSDVPGADPFWLFIERAALHGIISGYTCGTAPAGACDNLHRPYFLAGNAVSRGQAAKFISNSFFPNCQTPRRQGASNHRLGDSTR